MATVFQSLLLAAGALALVMALALAVVAALPTAGVAALAALPAAGVAALAAALALLAVAGPAPPLQGAPLPLQARWIQGLQAASVAAPEPLWPAAARAALAPPPAGTPARRGWLPARWRLLLGRS